MVPGEKANCEDLSREDEVMTRETSPLKSWNKKPSEEQQIKDPERERKIV